MKRSLKRLTALVLALSMTLSLLSATAWATDTETLDETTAEIVVEDDGEIVVDMAEESAEEETPSEEAAEEAPAEEGTEETPAEESATDEATGEETPTEEGSSSAGEAEEDADTAKDTSEAETPAGEESDAEAEEETDETSAEVSAAATDSDFYWNISSTAVTCSAVDGDLPSASTLYCGNTYYFNIQFNTDTVSVQTAKLYIKTPSSSSYSLVYSDSAGSGKKMKYRNPTYTFTSSGTYYYYWYVVYNSGSTQTLKTTTVTVNAKSSMTISKSNYSGTYDGSSHTFTLTVSGPSSYKIYYSSSTQLTSSNYSSSGSTTKPTRTVSGGVKVYYYVKDGTGKYNDASGSAYIYIKPKVTMTAYSGTYDGSSHTFTSSLSGTATLYYSTSTALTYSNYSSSGTTTKPTRTDAGTTTVYYIAVPKSGLITSSTVTTGTTSITISKASMTTSKSSYKGTYDGSYHTFTLTVSGPSSYTIYYSTSTELTSSNYTSGTTSKPTRKYSGGVKVYYYIKDGTGNYNNKYGSVYIYINPKVTMTAYSGTYDGSAHTFTPSLSGSATLYYSTSTELTYSNYSTSGTTTKPTRTNVGTTTVYYIAVPSSGLVTSYTVTTGTTSITISKATTSVTTTNYTGTYDGSAHTFSMTVSGPSSYTVYYSTSTKLTSSNYTSGTTTKPTSTDAGGVQVYYYVKDNTGNYSDASGSAYIYINPKVTAKAYSGTYDGSKHSASVTATGGATVYYSTSTELTYSNYSTSGTTTKPTRTNAGTTTVYYIAVPTSGIINSKTVTTGTTSIKISKADMTTSKANYSGTYDGKSHTFTLKVTAPSGSSDYTIYYSKTTKLTSSNYSSSGTTTKPSRTSAGTTTVYYYIKDNTGNYNDASGSATITLSKADMTTSKSNYSGTYDGSSHTFTLKVTTPSGSSDYTIYYSKTTKLTSSNYSSSGTTTKPTRTSAGTTTVYYYIKDNTGNYNAASGSATITLSKADMTTSKSKYSGTYDGKSHTFTLKVTAPSGSDDYTIYYSKSTKLTSSNYSSSGTTTKPTRTNAGTTKVYYYIKDNTGNYNDASGSATIKISKADMTTSKTKYSGTYDGKSHTFTLKVTAPSGSDDYTIYYSTSTKLTSSNYTSGSTTKPTRKKVGTTTVYYYIKDNTGNYNDASGSATIKISKASQTLTASAASTSIYVGKTTTITAKTTGDGEISYSSSDTSVATVSSAGKVTAKKPGTAKITVKAASSSNYEASNSKTITITVKLNKTTISSLTNTSSGVTVKWSKVSGAKGYYVYRNGKQVKKITSGSTVKYTDTGAKTNCAKYQYKVYAYYGSTKSAASSTKTIYYVSCPTISSVTSDVSGYINMEWSTNSNATGFQIALDTSSSFNNPLNKYVTGSYANISKITSGKTYYVKVRAYKTVSGTKYYSAWSSSKKVTVS